MTTSQQARLAEAVTTILAFARRFEGRPRRPIANPAALAAYFRQLAARPGLSPGAAAAAHRLAQAAFRTEG
jgi:hypothetical protein